LFYTPTLPKRKRHDEDFKICRSLVLTLTVLPLAEKQAWFEVGEKYLVFARGNKGTREILGGQMFSD
jgi:hypothetical protein